MWRLMIGLAVHWLLLPVCNGSILQNFFLDNQSFPVGTVSANTFSMTISGLSDNSVTFDATLTAVGSTAFVAHDSTGLGLGASPSDTTIESGESITVAMTISNVVGGTVSFDGFTDVMLGSFANTVDDAVISLDNSLATTTDNLLINEGTGGFSIPGSPAAFTIFGGPLVSTSFQLSTVSTKFTATSAAVPEPGAFLLLLCSSVAAGAKFSRRQVRASSPDAKACEDSGTKLGLDTRSTLDPRHTA